jgi:hypothetical protein
MKKISFILLSFACIHASATHMLNAQISVEHVGHNGSKQTYEITVVVFRDCLNGQADFDVPIKLGAYGLSTNTVIDTIELPLLSRQIISYMPVAQFCFETGLYRSTIDMSEDFYLSTHRCCRIGEIQNVDPNEGVTIYTEVKLGSANTGIGQPFFNAPIVQPLAVSRTYDISSIDTVADSTVYELANPLTGGNRTDPLPLVYPRPYPKNPFMAGYSLANPLGSANTISIERYTGKLTINLQWAGGYAIGILVKRYFNGIAYYTQFRDLTILACYSCFTSKIDDGSVKMNQPYLQTNPVNKQLVVKGLDDSSAPYELNVLNSNGQVVYQENQNKLSPVQIAYLPSGFYLLEIRKADEVFFLRFCKE